jgi:hypothetical protein
MANRAEAVVKFPERDPFDFPPNTDKVSYMGVDYHFRELTVAETDNAREMSIDGDKFDGRLMTRLMITTASTDPKIDFEQLAKLPQRLYSAIVDLVNELNDPEALKAVDPGNS